MTFKYSITVLDTETTNLFPEKAEIVEIAGAKWRNDKWQTESTLLGANNGIPPEASAKNNISNRMIQGLPTFEQSIDKVCEILGWPDTEYYVAHNANYDRTVLAYAWDRLGNTQFKEICDNQKRWICTWRLSQHILAHEFADCEYGLNYLRYRLDLPVEDNIQQHRAKDDTYLCAVLFDYLVSAAIKNKFIDPTKDICLQLMELCWSPIIQKTWPFGKYRGTPLIEIPNDYYTWALANLPALMESSKDYNMDLAESVRQALETRLSDSQFLFSS